MDLHLNNKIYLVGGASSGIGHATTDLLLKNGARVIAVARDGRKLMKAYSSDFSREAIQEKRLDLVSADLTNRNWVESSPQLAHVKELDGIIMTAGSGSPVLLGDSLSAFEESVSRNIAPSLASIGQLRSCLLPLETSSITLVTSIAGIEYVKAPVEYAMAKSCLHTLVKHWSWELKPVRVNAIAPGNVATKASVWQRRLKEDPKGLQVWLNQNVAQGRLGNAEEIANFLVFLASPAASFITGATVVIDGGQVKTW